MSGQDVDTAATRLEKAMLAGEVAWWEMDVETGAVSFHENKARMLDRDPAAFEHYEDFTDLLHPEDHERAMESMRAHLEGRAEKYDVEYRSEAADGSYHWFHDVGGISKRASDGSPLRVAGIVIDITARKAAAARAEVRNEQLALLNRIVRHDIANDMTVALGALDMLEERLSEDEHAELDQIREATEHVVAITDSVGEVLNALDAEETSETEQIRIDELVDAEVASVAERFTDATVTVDGSIPEVEVAGSPLLASAISNLLENAIEHNDTDSPTITVEGRAEGESVTLRVADDGPGIPDDLKESVFELGETRSPEGSGMGLFIASTLIETFGGSISIEDNEPRGAVFVISLQRA